MFFLQRPEKGYKPLTNGHANGDVSLNKDGAVNSSNGKHMNGHVVNGKINGLTNGTAAANGGNSSANGLMNGAGSAYKNGAVLANGIANGHTDLAQRKVK